MMKSIIATTLLATTCALPATASTPSAHDGPSVRGSSNAERQLLTDAELANHLDELVGVSRMVLWESDYRVNEIGATEDPGCVLRVYEYLTKEVHTGTRLSIAAQTRCEKPVADLRHKAQLIEFTADNSGGNTPDHGGITRFVGPGGAAERREDARWWWASKRNSQYLHQANVRTVCSQTGQTVDWDSLFEGKVTYQGREWTATAFGDDLHNCWV